MKTNTQFKLFLLIIFIYSNVSSQTFISGGINADTNWTTQNSPYIITGNTVIFGNNTLTIEPGVIVKFENNVQLRIQGSLIANGNSTNNITFTSNDSNPQKGSWNEINLEFNAVCILDYVLMEYADNALRYNQISTSSTIKNSIFQFNNNGINVNYGSPQFPITIESVKFIDNNKGIANFYDEVNLTDCEFKNNEVGAELVESFIDSCIFEGNTNIGLVGHTSTIQNSTFISNNIGLEQSFSGGSDSSIMWGNTIKNNSIGLKITGNSPMATFTDNTICNNYTYNVENTSSYSGQDLSNNCWCTEDNNEIENSIFHGMDDINFGVVVFTPTTTNCTDNTLNTNDFFESKEDYLFYPNPVVEELNFNNNFDKEYEIYSINGVLVKKGVASIKIDLSNIKPGIYMMKIQTSNQSKSIFKRLIKK
ncbi:T9SS type A sorting domain-containing protein [Mangrovimonas xylaniphaga]|uniref:T9SS type A sorting domain-containing protein n=1 Tax=Mangrovimonas xylaniphaga TaxID=1645915 RepID=UPI0006B4FEC1|nr:T9SS type A sorting domain-containing protein [Mangrovimonas xylaniphaga]